MYARLMEAAGDYDHELTSPPLSSSSRSNNNNFPPEPISEEPRKIHPINIHRRPGFWPKTLLLSLMMNAMLLMVVGYQYMKIKA